MLHLVPGKNGFVMAKSGQDGVAGNVGGQHYAAHAGQGQGRAGVHAMQLAMGHLAQNGRGVERAAHFGHIVHILGFALQLGDGAFVEGRLAHGLGGGGCQSGFMGGVHGRTSTAICSKVVALWPWLSFQKRVTRLASSWRR